MTLEKVNFFVLCLLSNCECTDDHRSAKVCKWAPVAWGGQALMSLFGTAVPAILMAALVAACAGAPSHPKRVPMSGTANFRDVGGYATVDGTHVRRDVLFRSDDLASLNDSDLDTFALASRPCTICVTTTSGRAIRAACPPSGPSGWSRSRSTIPHSIAVNRGARFSRPKSRRAISDSS